MRKNLTFFQKRPCVKLKVKEDENVREINFIRKESSISEEFSAVIQCRSYFLIYGPFGNFEVSLEKVLCVQNKDTDLAYDSLT